jgi:hypothetical protein
MVAAVTLLICKETQHKPSSYRSYVELTEKGKMRRNREERKQKYLYTSMGGTFIRYWQTKRLNLGFIHFNAGLLSDPKSMNLHMYRSTDHKPSD